MTGAQLPVVLFGALLFTMIGPLQSISLFSKATADMTRRGQVRTAFIATSIAAFALTLAVLLGASAMVSVGTTRSSLIIAAGLILAVAALRKIFVGTSSVANGEGRLFTPALSPIAIPGIVTPVGVAIVIIFASYFPEFEARVKILGLIAAVLILNLVAMLGANWFLRAVGTAPLLVLGAVFGVLQVAMGVEMIISGIVNRRSAIEAGASPEDVALGSIQGSMGVSFDARRTKFS